LTSLLLRQHNQKFYLSFDRLGNLLGDATGKTVAQHDKSDFPDATKKMMKQSPSGRVLSIAMLLLGLGGASYSAFERIYAPSASSLKYEVLFVMWLVLGIGWGSRLLPNGPGESRKTPKKDRSDTSKTHE